MTRRICYDTEFIEGPVPAPGPHGAVPTIELISIGLVNADATTETYYAVSAEVDFARMMARPWLRRHVVLPHLPLTYEEPEVRFGAELKPVIGRQPIGLDLGHPDVKPRHIIADEVVDFLTGPLDDGEDVELWANFAAYDHVVMHWLWGGMADPPARVPWDTNDIQQYARMLGIRNGEMPTQTSGEHHALHDALHDAVLLRHLDGIMDARPW